MANTSDLSNMAARNYEDLLQVLQLAGYVTRLTFSLSVRSLCLTDFFHIHMTLLLETFFLS